MGETHAAAFKAEMERDTPRGPTVNEMCCIRKVAEQRMWRTKRAMQQRGALAAKRAADRVWKQLGKEMPCVVHPPATTYPVSSRWELWPGATAAELAEAERLQKGQIRGDVPLGRLEVRVDEPPPPPTPPPPEGWKPIPWMETEAYKIYQKLSAGAPLRIKLDAFKAAQAGTSTAPPPPPPPKDLLEVVRADPEKKRMSTALYKRIVERMPMTACPEHRRLKVGLQVHSGLLKEAEVDLNLAGLLRGPPETFNAVFDKLIKKIVAAEEEADKPPEPTKPEPEAPLPLPSAQKEDATEHTMNERKLRSKHDNNTARNRARWALEDRKARAATERLATSQKKHKQQPVTSQTTEAPSTSTEVPLRGAQNPKLSGGTLPQIVTVCVRVRRCRPSCSSTRAKGM